MSKEIGKVKGRFENINCDGPIAYDESTIYLTRFMGGTNGSMVQLTIDSRCYIQLTKRQAFKLIKILLKRFL